MGGEEEMGPVGWKRVHWSRSVNVPVTLTTVQTKANDWEPQR